MACRMLANRFATYVMQRQVGMSHMWLQRWYVVHIIISNMFVSTGRRVCQMWWDATQCPGVCLCDFVWARCVLLTAERRPTRSWKLMMCMQTYVIRIEQTINNIRANVRLRNIELTTMCRTSFHTYTRHKTHQCPNRSCVVTMFFVPVKCGWVARCVLRNLNASCDVWMLM